VGGEDFTWCARLDFSFWWRFLGYTRKRGFTAVDIGRGVAATTVEGDEAEGEEDAHGVAGVVGGSGVTRYHGGLEDQGTHAAAQADHWRLLVLCFRVIKAVSISGRRLRWNILRRFIRPNLSMMNAPTKLEAAATVT